MNSRERNLKLFSGCQPGTVLESRLTDILKYILIEVNDKYIKTMIYSSGSKIILGIWETKSVEFFRIAHETQQLNNGWYSFNMDLYLKILKRRLCQ